MKPESIVQKKPIILGIETSCDETAVALISENQDGNPKILSKPYF